MQCARRLSTSRSVEPGEWLEAPVPTGVLLAARLSVRAFFLQPGSGCEGRGEGRGFKEPRLGDGFRE